MEYLPNSLYNWTELFLTIFRFIKKNQKQIMEMSFTSINHNSKILLLMQ